MFFKRIQYALFDYKACFSINILDSFNLFAFQFDNECADFR